MKYVLTRKESNEIMVISDTLGHNENGNPVVESGVLTIGFPVNEYSVEYLPEDVKIHTHCYDGKEFTYNQNYPFDDNARTMRLKLLEETDWTQLSDAPITEECSKSFKTYRQALRDITEQDGYPYSVVWPEMPVVIKK